jgi:hypothetical protein
MVTEVKEQDTEIFGYHQVTRSHDPKQPMLLGTMAHTCNPSYLAG